MFFYLWLVYDIYISSWPKQATFITPMIRGEITTMDILKIFTSVILGFLYLSKYYKNELYSFNRYKLFETYAGCKRTKRSHYLKSVKILVKLFVFIIWNLFHQLIKDTNICVWTKCDFYFVVFYFMLPTSHNACRIQK